MRIARCECNVEGSHPWAVYALGCDVGAGDATVFGCVECVPRAFQRHLEALESLPREGAVFEALQLLSGRRQAEPDREFGTGLRLFPVERAILLLDSLQTEEERASGTTTDLNMVGFRGHEGKGDAKFGTALAERLRGGFHLSHRSPVRKEGDNRPPSPSQYVLARRMLWKYCGQIARVRPTTPPREVMRPATRRIAVVGSSDLFDVFD